ncbi:hemerythrin domain-containing protein [Saccharolobus caldissimus]|uniref:Hemerythrin-like domain-containing protein n=1 Tax=Saccharolobus caldissimus TaxID=1702097 RepID=A0AAQ4CUQ8_9CREN|nr:hemerythrin domain-containing protein [Saccharolobus caldissimus]BDB99539.1 hypothetical protein SACC_25560 [Saccharolobus caldissimus]
MWIRDPLDLLLFEHSVLRIRYTIALSLLDRCEDEAFRILSETHDFVVNWHAKIEDKYLFPLYGEKAKPLHNDHLLIEKYGNSVIKDRIKNWVPRYVKIVLDHNKNEEVILFPLKINTEGIMEKILKEMEKYPKYFEITGLR